MKNDKTESSNDISGDDYEFASHSRQTPANADLHTLKSDRLLVAMTLPEWVARPAHCLVRGSYPVYQYRNRITFHISCGVSTSR